MKLVLVTKCSHAIAQLHKHNGRNPARFKLDGNDQRRRRQQRSDIKGNVVSVLCSVEDIHIVVRLTLYLLSTENPMKRKEFISPVSPISPIS